MGECSLISPEGSPRRRTLSRGWTASVDREREQADSAVIARSSPSAAPAARTIHPSFAVAGGRTRNAREHPDAWTTHTLGAASSRLVRLRHLGHERQVALLRFVGIPA
jgi:hypothetical protein